jgi:hypothetical protein
MTKQQEHARPGLTGADKPGQRSGRGSGSVLEQVLKDQQRNSNEKAQGADDRLEPVRDSTG